MAMTLRLDEELDCKLTALAADQRMSKQQLVHRVLDEYVERGSRRARIRSIARQVAEENSGLLRRLGE